MKVSDFIKKLEKMPQNYYVIVSKDEEGNGFNLFRDISVGYFDAEEYEFTDCEEDKNGLDNAICLWP